ncbi:MAG: Na(+)/H(+) antiporter subunit D [Hyphomicrobiaceae bacterium]
MGSVAPFLIFFLGAVLVAATRGRVQSVLLLAIPVIGALNLFAMTDGPQMTVQLLGYTLTLVRVDKLSLLFGYLFHLAAFIGILFSLHVEDRSQHAAGVLYAGSAIGAVFAGDLITLFLFWEVLAVSSVFLVFARGTEPAYRSGMRYLVIQILSGVILMAGVLMRVHETGSIAFDAIELTGPGAWLILIAIGIKCGFPLAHNWLTDAYPEATPTGTVLLSAFTTKVAVYALARSFAGTELLVYVGATMTMFPIFFAVIENDLRRVLAYSMVNQIGFMVCGIGLGTALAVNGAVAHAFNDVIFKGLLFMSMGAVLMRTGTTKASELGGLYKSMPWTTTFCMVGAASISAVPLFSGFVSKSMVMVAALEEGHPVVWLLLLFASAGVLEHAGIKIPYFAFFAHDSGKRPAEAPANMLLAMGLAAAICIFIGCYPAALYALLPYPVDYVPYTLEHVVTQLQLLVFATLAVVVLMLTNLYPPEVRGINIDFEWTYRKILPAIVQFLHHRLGYAWVQVRGVVSAPAASLLAGLYRHHGPRGVLGRQWPTGNMAFWTTVLLGGCLIFYYI